MQSNCIAVEPLDTPLGRKRAINQNACNKDFSCTKGFCPSFVELEGATLRKPDADALQARASALLGAAANADGRAATVLDFTGLAQKNGAVVSQVRLATSADAIPASRIGEGAVKSRCDAAGRPDAGARPPALSRVGVARTGRERGGATSVRRHPADAYVAARFCVAEGAGAAVAMGLSTVQS